MSQLLQLERALKEVLKPILYADIFDYPLTFDELLTYSEVSIDPAQLRALLEVAISQNVVVRTEGFYSLAGRPHLAAKRKARQQAADRLWPKAVHYGRWLATLPFVKMVAVTGSLAVDNPRDGVDDIDFLIVTRPGRLWLCRALIILVVRYGHLRGVHLCPNYLITENRLDFDSHDFFTAREVLQMKPLFGKRLYGQLRARNRWVDQFFPQGHLITNDRLDDRLGGCQHLLKSISERLLAGLTGNWLERRLRSYQVTKHTRQAARQGTLDSVVFTADECKGHYDGHGHKTMQAYRRRLERISV